MPEGPEVWALTRAIRRYVEKNFSAKTLLLFPSSVDCHGKHLLLSYVSVGLQQDWSFAMTGTVRLTEPGLGSFFLEKLATGYLPGQVVDNHDCLQTLGLDWLQASEEQLASTIFLRFVGKRAKMGALLLDQKWICGIGVAWGSEILLEANLRPDIAAAEQDLSGLKDVMVRVRHRVLTLYQMHVDALDTDGLRDFINGWFQNLYGLRQMVVYKRGNKVLVSGRTWWVPSSS